MYILTKEKLIIKWILIIFFQTSSCLAKPQNFRTNTGIKVSMETVKENLKSLEHQHYLANFGRSYEEIIKSHRLEGSGDDNNNSPYYDDFLQERFLPLTIPPPTDDYVTTRVSIE